MPGRSRGSRWLRQGQSAPRADPSVLPLGLEPPRPLEAGSQRVVLTAVALGAPGASGGVCAQTPVCLPHAGRQSEGQSRPSGCVLSYSGRADLTWRGRRASGEDTGSARWG